MYRSHHLISEEVMQCTSLWALMLTVVVRTHAECLGITHKKNAVSSLANPDMYMALLVHVHMYTVNVNLVLLNDTYPANHNPHTLT